MNKYFYKPTSVTIFWCLPKAQYLYLFSLFFLLNVVIGFGQEVTISSPQEPGPTDANPIEVLFEFSDAVNQSITGSLGLDNATVLSEERLIPTYENFNSLNLPTRNIQASVEDFTEQYALELLLGGNFGELFQEYLTEKFKNLIVAFDINSNEEIYYLTFANGVFKYNVNSSDQQVIPPGEFESPIDILIDNKDRILVADNDAYSVKVFSPLNYTQLYEIGGDQGADSDEFYGPTGLAKNANNDIYVVDTYPGEFTGNDPNNKVVDKVKVYQITDESFNYIDFFGKNELDDPFRLAVDSNDNVYVSDSGGSNGRIRIFDTDGILKRTIASSSEHSPASIAIDTFGYIYVADYNGDITFNGIYQNPIELLSKFDVLKGNTYSIDVYKPLTDDFNTEVITTFEKELKLPLDLALDNCENILILDLDFGGDIDNADFDFDIEMFRRNDKFKLLVEPNSEGIVELELDSPNLFKCGPQPEGVFSIDYETEAAPDPTFDCPIESEIDPIFYVNNCSYSVPDYTISNPQGFDNDPFLVQTFTENANSVSVNIEVYDGEDGDLVDECTFDVDLIDNQAPVISDCPPENTEFTILAGKTHSLKDYTGQITVTDNCADNSTIIQDPLPGKEIKTDQVVTLTAIDQAGNESAVCSFTVEITEVAVPEPTFDCPVANNLNPIYYEDNCSYEVPKYKISNPQHFDPEPYLIQSHTENGDSVSVTIKVYNGEGGELVDICDFEFALEDNQAPVISGCPPENIQFTIQEGETHILDNYTGQISVNDNCDSNPSIVQDPPAGTEITADRLVTLTVTDKAGNETECDFMVEITEEEPNTAPIAENNTYQVNHNEVLTIPASGILQNDTDSEDDILTATLVSDVSNGTLTLNADGSFTYTPNSGYTGQDLFTYTANDGTDDSNVATVTITVNSTTAPNTAPVAANNTYSIDQNEVLTIPAPGILQNDTDSEGDNLTATLVSDVSNGTLTFNADGSFTYIPNSGYTGQDSFTYTANDGESDSNIATVTITVTKNDPAAPEINCLNHEIFLDKNGKASLEPETIYIGDRKDLKLTLSQTEFNCSNLGVNTVTLKATDPETGLSSLCTAHIEVLDIISPEASCVSGYVLELGEDGTASLDAAALDNNSTDNCGVVSRSVSPQNFTRNDIGDVSVRLSVRDAAGNEGSCETVIKVVDKQTSDFKCKEKVSVSLNENGNATLAVEELYTGDASGINFSKNNYEFSCTDLGTKTIQFNYSGRIEGSCSIKVEVKDELAPTINTNLINASLDEDGFFYLDESRIDAEDNCNTSLQITFEKTVFTCEDVGQNSILVEAEDASGNKTSKEITVIASGDPCEPTIDFNDIRISPNPSAGIFKIGTPTDVKINEVRVFDSRGRFIAQKDYNMNSRFYKLNLESLEESVYTLQIFTNNGEFVKRIIIKR